MKSCSKSLVIREMQAKVTKPTTVAIIKKTENISLGEDVEKIDPSYISGGPVK